MSLGYRFMRMIVFFDLPTQTKKDLRNYNDFRKFLIKEGFLMMQESVYTKLLLKATMANLLRTRIKKNAPTSGLIQLLLITEKQFASIEFVTGEGKSIIENSDKRFVEY